MHQADRFLFSLVLHAGRRGRRFVIKKQYATELTDKWLYLMADVDPKKVRNGTRSKEEKRRLVDAMLPLNKFPLYVEDADDDSTSSNLTEPDF